MGRANPSRARRSPTPALLLGLVITVTAVAVYSAYVTRQISGLRRLQTELVDRDRLDSLELLRIQNDLNTLGVAMCDMLDNTEPYPLVACRRNFTECETISTTLCAANSNWQSPTAPRNAASICALVTQFWDAADRVFASAQDGHVAEARAQIQTSLQARQAALSTLVARLLIQNNDGEREATARTARIYDGVQRQVDWLLGATLASIGG